MGIIKLLVVLLLLAAADTFAGQFPAVEEVYLYPSLQYFTWKDNTTPRQVLENGLMYGLGGGARLNFLQTNSGALTVALKAELFGGDISYDGQLQDGSPTLTDVIYLGTKEEANLGWRFPLGTAAAIEPFGGLGYRWWLRSLQGEGGYPEKWSSYYAKSGVRWSWSVTPDLKLFISGGALYPFDSDNRVDFPGAGKVTVYPRGEWSGFAESGMRYGGLRATFFYEGLRYAQSDPVAAFSTFENKTIHLFQPTSSSDVFGVSLGWAFK